MIARLLKWVAVLLLPKILKQADKPANAMLDEYREAAAKVLGDCADTSKEMAAESAAVSAEMAKLEAVKLVVKNNESLRVLLLSVIGVVVVVAIIVAGLTTAVLAALLGVAGTLPSGEALSVAGGGIVVGLGIPVLAWLFVLRQGAWQNLLLSAVKRIRYGEPEG